MKRHSVVRAAAMGALLAFAAAPHDVQAQSAALSPQMQSVRASLDKYNDPIVAVHDGYLSTVACIDFPKGGSEGSMRYAAGGMGVHFFNPQYISPTLDPAKPQVLIYEPVGDKLRLVAAEWFVPTELAKDTRPSIFGKELEGPMEGHQPLMPAGAHHYDLHVWLWKPNSEGVFAPTNPSIKCPKSGYSFSEDAPKMVHKHQ